jgi:hypothetical protein
MLFSNCIAVLLLLVMTGTAVVANRGATGSYNCGAPFCKRFGRVATATESVVTATVVATITTALTGES